jgi:hypothetical protein
MCGRRVWRRDHEADLDLGFSGRCWGVNFESRFASSESMSIIEQLNGLMPQDGESGDDVAQVHLNVRRRIVELAAGTVAEELFLPGEPWPAADDRRQERELASLITSSRESREAYIAACRVEVRSILQRYDNVVRSLAAELLQRRTMTGEEIDMVISRAIGERQLREEHQRRREWRQREQNAGLFMAQL